MIKLISVALLFNSILLAQSTIPDSCKGYVFYSNKYNYQNKFKIEINIYNNLCKRWKYYELFLINRFSKDTLQTIEDFTEIYDEFNSSFKGEEPLTVKNIEKSNSFIVLRDLNFDKIPDLLIYDMPTSLNDGFDYNVWLWDTTKNQIIKNKLLSGIFHHGAEVYFDTINCTLEYGYDTGCSECWANDTYKFINNKFVLIKRSSSYYDQRMGQQNYKLINHFFTLVAPYEAKWGKPLKDINFNTCIILKKRNVYNCPFDNSQVEFTLEPNDTIECSYDELVFNKFGKVLVTQTTKLQEIDSYPISYKTFFKGDTLSTYFIDEGIYEFAFEGKYYKGKPFWRNDMILDNYVATDISGKLIEQPEVKWNIYIKKNKDEGCIELSNEEMSSLNIKGLLQPIQ